MCVVEWGWSGGALTSPGGAVLARASHPVRVVAVLDEAPLLPGEGESVGAGHLPRHAPLALVVVVAVLVVAEHPALLAPAAAPLPPLLPTAHCRERWSEHISIMQFSCIIYLLEIICH